MPITPTETTSSGRTYDIPVKSPADAAQRLARIHSVNTLLSDTRTQAPDVVLPGSAFVADPDAFSNLGNDGYRNGGPGTVPNPGQGTRPQPTTPTHPQPGVTTQPQPPAPAPPTHPQPGVTAQPSSVAPTATPDPEPVLKEATYTGPTMFDIGNSAPPNQGEGQPWVVQDPNLGKITNTIVAGTGGQTVDSVIEKPDGKTVTLRRVANGMGGYTMWMNAGGVMSVSYSPGTNGAAPGHILQYTMADGDDPANPSILSDLIDGGRTSVNLDMRTGNTWGTSYLDNGEQEVTVLTQDKFQQIFRTYHDEMGNPYTEQVGEIRPDMTGWYLGTDGLRRNYNPDHSVDVSGMDSTRTSQNLHITRTGQVSGTLSNDVQARMVTITPNDTGSLEVTQDFRGKTLHITRFDLKGNPLRDWALGDNGKWIDYTRNTDGSTTFNQPDGTKIQIKDIWRYTVWNPDGSHEDYDESPKVDTRSFGQKLKDAAGNAWDAGFEKGRGLALGLSSMTGFSNQYNDIATLMGWDSRLPTQKIPFANIGMRLDPVTGLAYGMTTGILKGVFDTTAADFKTAISAGKATGDWLSGKTSFADAVVRVWQEAAFDSINTRSQFFLMTDLRGATEHPSKTAGELTFGALTLLLPTKGIGRGLGTATKTSISTAAKAAELTNAAVHAIRRSSIADSALRDAMRSQMVDSARAVAKAVQLNSASAARTMSQALESFRTNRAELLERLQSESGRTEYLPRQAWLDDSGRPSRTRNQRPEVAEGNITGIIKLDAWIERFVKDLSNGPPPTGGLVRVGAGGPFDALPGSASRNWLEGRLFEQRNRGGSSVPRSGSSRRSTSPQWNVPADIKKTPADFNSVDEYQVWLANTYPGYRNAYYRKNGQRKLTEVRDHTGTTPPHLVEVSAGVWDLASKKAPAFRPHYGSLEIHRERRDSSLETMDIMDPFASDRRTAVDKSIEYKNLKLKARDLYENNPTSKNKKELDLVTADYKAAHHVATKNSEIYGETVWREVVQPENFPGGKRVEVEGPGNGNDRFDDILHFPDGVYMVVEAKADRYTSLNERALPNGKKALEGTQQYFFSILLAMLKSRGEAARVARALYKAFGENRIMYIEVRGKSATFVDSSGKRIGLYDGYIARNFDLSKGGTP
ncbi:hypothetical protein [Nocardia sp. NPDC059228]|uniref:hypothetical protein n=1 Tax=Nocardia sp. NPDC059228 TaxID=3346777 RepID=UPI0036CE15F4